MRSRVLVWLLLLAGCSGIEQSQKKEIRQRNERKDRVHRLFRETAYPEMRPIEQVRGPYPWELGYTGIHPPITKEAFRCKGLHKHSLPIRGKEEFIYPVLVDLLNYVQLKTRSSVTVTCGHRCPVHHASAEASPYHAGSKHMIGAEVDFYVKGMENKPEEVVALVMQYYKERGGYKGKTEYEKFSRLDSVKTDVATVPWYNKEILIKLYRKEEGRDLDNEHPYPYICLQVRFDREKNEKVTFSSEKAYHGYTKY